ncbi:MAG TPA: thioesterase family protein [Polyangium sp.]|nr:thioesterase family protein [Polyangium sp.]
MPADLARDTAVVPVPGFPHKFVTELPDSWNWRMPSGGVLMTVGLRALREAVADPSFVPISATTTFCRPVPEGRIEIDVAILRQGNAATQARASLRTPDADGVCLEVTGTFARERHGIGIDYLDAVFPAVPMPNEAPSIEEKQRIDGKVRRYRFHENFDICLAQGNRWWESAWSPGPARLARWMRYKVPQKMGNGMIDPFALPPIIDMMPPAIRQKMGPEGPQYYAPSLDLTVHFLDPSPSDWLLVSTYARRARAGYATAEAEVWGDDGKLIAYATQTMFLRTPGG